MAETLAKAPKPWWLGAIFVAIGIAVLLALGTWQMQRLRWKEGLLAHIAALQGAQAVPVDSVVGRSPQDLDFVRVRLDCPLRRAALDALPLYAVWDGDPGQRWIVACDIPGTNRSVLADLGFLADDAPPILGPKPLGPELRDQSLEVVGVLRIPEGANRFTPPNPGAPASNEAPPTKSGGLWYWRDVPAMAARLNAGAPLPAVLMVEHPDLGEGYPRPAPIPKEISNRHLEYALTWYGLAVALAGVYIALLLRRRLP